MFAFQQNDWVLYQFGFGEANAAERVLGWGIDRRGHGNHVAGTIAATAGNGKGVEGTGSIRFYTIRAIGDNGRGYESDMCSAIEQLVDAGSKMVNLSAGIRYTSTLSERLWNKVVDEDGTMVIAAAGNGCNGQLIYPPSHPKIVPVATEYEFDRHYKYSNQNKQVEMAAHGHNILPISTSTTSVQTDDFGLPDVHINGSCKGVGSKAEYPAYRDISDGECKKAKNGGICLLVKESTDHAQELLEFCDQNGGGSAIIFDAETNSRIDIGMCETP
jgi:subtilisin family serine protease